MNRTTRLLFTFILLLSTVHRLPAPIIEEQKPTPAAERPAKPKAKHKIVRESSEESTKRQASPTPKTQAISNGSVCDGTWTGHYKTGLAGDIQHTLVISGSGTVVQETDSVGSYTSRAKCDGTTTRWDWKVNSAGNSMFTPNRDGRTAVLTVHAVSILGSYDSTATFYKTSP
jgi:hypothetical protein